MAVLDLQLLGMSLREPGPALLVGLPGLGLDGARDQPHRKKLFTSCPPTLRKRIMIRSEPSSASNGSSDDYVIDCDLKELYYGAFKAVRDTRVPIKKGEVTAFIGPSGCGKSTVLRCLNRMNDLIRGFRFEGHVQFRGRDIYHPASIPWRSGVTSEWFFSSRTRSR